MCAVAASAHKCIRLRRQHTPSTLSRHTARCAVYLPFPGKTEFDYAVNGAFWIPGILQTIGLLMVNVINWGMLTEESFMGDDGGVASKVKAWVFVSFVFSFSGLIGAVWILVQEVQRGGEVEPATRGLLQNLFIFGSSLLFRIVRTSGEEA